MGSSEESNNLLYVALNLDTCYKMKYLVYCLNQLVEGDVVKCHGEEGGRCFERII